jgi:hypothetical protein
VDGPGVSGDLVAGGTLVFTGERGEQISGRNSAKVAPNLDGSLEVRRFFVITGGRGRFANATGPGENPRNRDA